MRWNAITSSRYKCHGGGCVQDERSRKREKEEEKEEGEEEEGKDERRKRQISLYFLPRLCFLVS